MKPVPGFDTQALVRGRDGALWRSVVRGGVFRYVNGEWQRNGNLAALPPDPAIVMTGRCGGRLWFGYTKNRIALLDGDSVQMLGIDAGLNVGSVTAIGTRGEHTWIGGERGLMRFDGRRFVPVKVVGENPYRALWGRDSRWSEPGTGLAFTIPPAFHQTRWFYALCLLLAGGLLVLLYRLRMRQVTAAVQARLEERIVERERIARELHDTLLQGFQGLMLRLQSVADRVKVEPEQAHRLIEQTLQRADAVLEEGRDRVKDLRAINRTPLDLSQIFLRVAQDAQPHPTKIRVSVEGTTRELQPIVREETEKIGIEAMSNALLHAKASTIDVGILFQHRRFALRISDDGIGIDPAILDAGRERHFGLTGMRERARGIRGRISIASRAGGGTEIELIIAAGIAYVAKRPALPRWWRRRFSTNRKRS